ncbi:hypothetical protein ACOSQ4_005338 [Xanthoceras sorbifolium]
MSLLILWFHRSLSLPPSLSEWNYICVDLRQINAIHQSWTTWEPYNHTYKLMPSIKAGQHGSLTTIPFQRCLFE